MSAHRYWRIYVNGGPGSGWVSSDYARIAEVELRTSLSGSDQTGSGTASVSTSYDPSSFGADKAFDNNTGTEWISDGTHTAQWLKYDFGSGNNKDIVEYTIRCSNAAGSLVNILFQYSDDNSSWTTVDTRTGLSWSVPETKTFSVTGGAVAARPVVFICT